MKQLAWAFTSFLAIFLVSCAFAEENDRTNCLARDVTLTVKVVNSSDQPVAGAFVSVTGNESEFLSKTDKDGCANFSGLSPGVYSAWARAAGHTASDTEQWDLLSGRRQEVLRLGAAYLIRGRVSDAEGQSIKSAIVSTFMPDDFARAFLGSAPIGSVKTNADGEFEINWDAQAPPVIVVSAPKFAPTALFHPPETEILLLRAASLRVFCPDCEDCTVVVERDNGMRWEKRAGSRSKVRFDNLPPVRMRVFTEACETKREKWVDLISKRLADVTLAVPVK